MSLNIPPAKSQWLLETYECSCFRKTEPTLCGGVKLTVFCCRGCKERGDYLMEQLSIEMDRVADAPAPPAADPFPELS